MSIFEYVFGIFFSVCLFTNTVFVSLFSNIYKILSEGYSGSIGKYVAPIFNIASKPITISGVRFNIIPIISFASIP